MDIAKIKETMEQEMVVALGCTDPVAIAYVAAAARQVASSGDIRRISIKLSKAIIKSAASVTIPGTKTCGVKMAAVLGAFFGNPDKKLEVLEGITHDNVEVARRFMEQYPCTVEEVENNTILYLEAEIETTTDMGKAVVIDDYGNWVYAELNNQPVFDKRPKRDVNEVDEIKCNLLLKDIWEFITYADINKDFEIVKKSILLNKSICVEGMTNEYGLQVGRTLQERAGGNGKAQDLTHHAVFMTAAGVDARMAGCPMPVISNSGSGNQGITATVPVVAVAEVLDLDEDIKIRGVALSNLVTIYAKEYFGRVSALCGANIAAMGAGCGVAYLLGGGLKEMERTIQNIAGNIIGMLCDGAKGGCALKVSTSVQAAMQAAFLAVKGINIKETDGIIEKEVENTLKNIGRMSSSCSVALNDMILEIMINKKHN